MSQFDTSTGSKTVGNWGYMLQGGRGKPLDADLLSTAIHDLLVIDPSRDGTDAGRFSPAEILRMKDGMGGPAVVASYVSIGEASDYRDYWQKGWTASGKAPGRLTSQAPEWLGPVNPEWPESRKVRYWDADWQRVLFNSDRTGEIDAIVRAGFDAAYLDIVDAYHFWGTEAAQRNRAPGDPTNDRQAAQRMVDFVVALTAHAREVNPQFFVIPQNGAFILDDLGADPGRRRAYLDAIGGIAVEDLYTRGSNDENNPFRPDRGQIATLQRDFLQNGKPVFVVEYLSDPKLIASFHQRALQDGFVPYAAPDRDLDRMAPPHDGTHTYHRATDRADVLRGSPLDDVLDGLGGNDKIYGRAGPDRLHGGPGDDMLAGGPGDDVLVSGTGNDILRGGQGADRLSGGRGNDSYFIDRADTIIEAARQGADKVVAAFSYTLGKNLEDLTLVGNAAVNGTGNALNNRLTGNAAANILRGGMGQDILEGGRGKDILDGGVDHVSDVFVFVSPLDSRLGRDRDVILNFVTGVDDVDLRPIDAVGSTRQTNEAFHWSDTAPAAHSVWWSAVPGRGVLVRGDVTGDAQPDFEILLEGLRMVSVSDILG